MLKAVKGLAILSACCVILAGTAALGAPAQDHTGSTGLNPFGIGADHHTSQAWPKWLPQMASIGLTETRSLRCGWADVEPEEGKWKWDMLDSQLRDGAAQHMDFTGIFMANAGWNKKDSPGGFPIHNLPAWSTYVSEMIKHVDGRAKYFEVWNEPPNGTHGSPASDYGKLVAATYDAAKAADPRCQVGLAAQSNNVNYLDQAIKAGAADHFDYLTEHPYEILGGVNSGWEPVYMSIVPIIRKMLAAEDPARVNVPIWFTELGAEVAKGLTPEIQGQLLVKGYAMGIAQGVACLQWFECMDGDSGKMGMLESNGTPRPAYTGMAQMIRYLGQHPSYLSWVLLNDKDYGFNLKYESTKGYKSAGWYTVPDNKEWHTMTWKIDDSQFVSKWGFNFALDSDGAQNSKYYIQSVTVTKVGK